MAAIVITTIRLVKGADEHQTTLAANVAVPIATPLVTQDPTTGRWILALATTAAALGDPMVAAHVAVAKEALTAYRAPCLLDVGEALAAMAIGDLVYASDTPGTLSTTAGTVSRVLGRVQGAFGSGATPDKLLQLL